MSRTHIQEDFSKEEWVCYADGMDSYLYNYDYEIDTGHGTCNYISELTGDVDAHSMFDALVEDGVEPAVELDKVGSNARIGKRHDDRVRLAIELAAYVRENLCV